MFSPNNLGCCVHVNSLGESKVQNKFTFSAALFTLTDLQHVYFHNKLALYFTSKHSARSQEAITTFSFYSKRESDACSRSDTMSNTMIYLCSELITSCIVWYESREQLNAYFILISRLGDSSSQGSADNIQRLLYSHRHNMPRPWARAAVMTGFPVVGWHCVLLGWGGWRRWDSHWHKQLWTIVK